MRSTVARLADEGLVDVILAVADNNDAGGVGEPLSRALRRIDPAHGFLVLEAPLVAMRLHFAERAGPNLRPHYAQKRFIVGVDGDKQMNEEAETCPVAAQPQLPPLVAPGEIDLGRVLRHDNAPTPASLRRALGGLLRDRLRGRLLRSEKAMGRYLPRAIPAKLANHQRARTGDVLEDPFKSARNSNIAAETIAHQRLPKTEEALNQKPKPYASRKRLDCVNAVAQRGHGTLKSDNFEQILA